MVLNYVLVGCPWYISSRNGENPDEIAVAGQCYKQSVHCVDPLCLIDVNQNSRSVSCRTVSDITIDHSSVYQIEVTVIQVYLLSSPIFPAIVEVCIGIYHI